MKKKIKDSTWRERKGIDVIIRGKLQSISIKLWDRWLHQQKLEFIMEGNLEYKIPSTWRLI